MRVAGRIKHECCNNTAAVLRFPLQGRHQARVVVQPQVVLEPHLPQAKLRRLKLCIGILGERPAASRLCQNQTH